MKRLIYASALLLSCVATCVSHPPRRPRIFGIAYVRILVTNMDKATEFYTWLSHSIPPSYATQSPCYWCERTPISKGMGTKPLGPIELEAIHPQDSPNLLSEVAFSTDNVERLRDFLLKNHIAAEKLTKCGEDACFRAFDPEHHRLVFVQKFHNSMVAIPAPPVIHAGFVVHDRAVEDGFYKDILGFHLYWQGGMKDDETNWVDMQVPDGTDWIEYMLNAPDNADHHNLGVMNHIALGVPDIKAARERLIENGWKPGEEPKMGRDGKWQLNLYDPDDTRVELMEFTPVEKPCCSDYSGPHPGKKP
jgi:catechol 2,3-dioxygenase-like lactoylglutathione lyase family enzyme